MIKPLSENDLVAMCDDQFMMPGAGRCTEHPTVISYERLKELFAELKTRQIYDGFNWSDVEELFGPLVRK